MAKPKKYPEVMALEVGGRCRVDGYYPAVSRAAAGYADRCNPRRKYICERDRTGNDGVIVTRLPDPEPRAE